MKPKPEFVNSIMLFTSPELIPLLALPVIHGFWQWSARCQQVVLPLDHTQPCRGWWLERSIRTLTLVPTALLAIALFWAARPLIEGPPSYPTEVTNIQILLSTSGSMNVPFGNRTRPDGNPFTRFDAVKETIDQFTQNRPEMRSGSRSLPRK